MNSLNPLATVAHRAFSRARRAGMAVMAAAAATAMPAANTAHAASYDISGSITFQIPSTVVLDSYSMSVPISISRQVLYDNVGPNRSWRGRAGSGADLYGLHASSYVGGSNIANGASGGLIFGADANVMVTYTDFLISGPAGAAQVQAPINFHLSGEQILQLREQHGIYMAGSGRVNIAGLTAGNIDKFIADLAAVSV